MFTDIMAHVQNINILKVPVNGLLFYFCRYLIVKFSFF